MKKSIAYEVHNKVMDDFTEDEKKIIMKYIVRVATFKLVTDIVYQSIKNTEED